MVAVAQSVKAGTFIYWPHLCYLQYVAVTFVEIHSEVSKAIMFSGLLQLYSFRLQTFNIKMNAHIVALK